MVLQHLMAWNDYSSDRHEISFWRTRSGVEIDFIVYGPQGLWAIEVKHNKQIHSSDTRALEAFREDYPTAKTLLLYLGTERFIEKNTLCLPCEEFLLALKPNLPLWPI